MQEHALFEIPREITRVINEIIEAQRQEDSGLVDELTEKLISLINLESNRYETMAHVIKYAQETAEALNKTKDTLRERVRQNMKQRHIKSADAGIFIVTYISGSKVEIDDSVVSAEELPERFQIQRIQANKPALKRAIKNGEKIEGVQLGDGIQIRRRRG